MESKMSNEGPRISVMYNFVRSRQLEENFPGTFAGGVWPTTTMRIGKGWGWVEESKWPFDGDPKNWPPSEPPGLDVLAKENRTFAYQRVCSVEDCIIILASNSLVDVTFTIDNSWSNAPDGNISIPNHQSIIGSHAIVLCGYNNKKEFFIFQNSWGISWGDKGYGYLPYKYFPDRFVEGWTFADKCPILSSEKSTNLNLLTHKLMGLLGQILYVVELIDSSQNEILGWTFLVEKGDYIDIEELFVKPTHRKLGNGLKLVTEIKQLSQKLGKPLRCWIPHSDSQPNNPALNAIIGHLGLSLRSSPVKWASKVGL